MNRGEILRGEVESVIDSGRASQGSIREGGQHREQTRPGRVSTRRNRGTTIPNRIGVGVPITHQKITSREKGGLGGKMIKENTSLIAMGISVDVGKLKYLPLEAKSRK
jgi:hypothetical protein